MRKPRVILYDDDPIILSILTRFFLKRSYEVYSYNEPVICPLYENLAERCEKFLPCADLMISDYQMPKMNGTELFQRQAERGCRLDISMKAIMSGSLNERLITQCKALGCSFFLKPFKFPEISDWLSEAERHYDLSQQLNDRRRSSRHEFQQDIEYLLNHGSQAAYRGITFNKSTEGLGLITDHPLNAGDDIMIMKGFEATHRKGIVRWCSQQSKTSYQVGVRLL